MKLARVGIDYHVEVDGHYYSVPYRYAREQVDVRMTAATWDQERRDFRLKEVNRAFYNTREGNEPAIACSYRGRL